MKPVGKMRYNNSLNTGPPPGPERRMHSGIPMAKGINNNNKAVDTVAYSIRRPALIVRGASKKYGSQLILHNLNMFAKEGTIYALTGSGGSGKSTILQIIAGLKTFTKGELLVYGAKPGSSASGIPGRRIGYLPQELALHKEFTVTENVQYFGRLYGMTLEKVKERLEVLANILSLQNCDEKLSKLSRSEQKRTSIACTLLHEPELILLDEPTKGLDPLFKRGIWTHLTKLVSDGRTSVILALQNIEEARQAHRLGVLRGGRLIVEDSPIALLQRHNSPLLEDVVARICYKETAKANAESSTDKKGKGKNGIEEVVLVEDWSAYGMPNGLPPVTEADVKSISYSEWMDQVSHEDDNLATKKAKPLKRRELENLPPYPNPSRLAFRLRALAIKQLKMTQRNLPYIMLRFVLTAVLISLFCLAVGPEPMGIRMGLVDNDSGSSNIIADCLEEEDMSFGCKPEKMSCRFLRTIQPDIVTWTLLNDTEDAEESLKRGTIAGYLEFTPMFSTEVFNKVVNNGNEDESALENMENFENSSSLVVHLDSSDTFLSRLLRGELLEKYKAFEDGIATDCDGLERGFSLDNNSTVMKMEDSPLNGSYEQNAYHSRFVIPAVAVAIVFFVSSLSSGLQFHREVRSGILARSFSAGVNTIEVLIFHWIIELIVLAVHVALVLVIPIFAFQMIPMNGFWLWPVLLLGIAGIGGLTLSFMVAFLTTNASAILCVSMLFLIPNLLFSGILWPIQSLIIPLQWISYFLPLSLSSQSARYMIIGGWDITVTKVWQGFVVISAWTTFFWIVMLLVILCRHLSR